MMFLGTFESLLQVVYSLCELLASLNKMQRIVMLLAVFVSVINSNQPKASEKAEGHPVNWILLHYHKTGHDLVEHFARSFTSNGCEASSAMHLRTHRKSVLPYLKHIYSKDITLIPGGELAFPWVDTLSTPESNQFRVVHFVRDPYDMIVSGFLYHVQIPIPETEKWLLDAKLDVCAFDHTMVAENYAAKLGTLRGDDGAAKVKAMILAAESLCKSLTGQYKNKSFSAMLQAAKEGDDEYAGLRLEAVRSLLQEEGGDVLRMGVNALYEDKRISKRVFTSQFPIGNKAVFLNTTTSVVDFLMNKTDKKAVTKGDQKPFWSCRSKEDIISDVEKRAFVEVAPATEQQSTGAAKHITSGYISTAKRQEYVQMLTKDPVLGPLLEVVKDALKVYN